MSNVLIVLLPFEVTGVGEVDRTTRLDGVDGSNIFTE